MLAGSEAVGIRPNNLFDYFMSMTQEQINVGLFDEVKKLQRENARLRDALQNLTHDCMASDFNEHWDSFKKAESILSNGAAAFG